MTAQMIAKYNLPQFVIGKNKNDEQSSAVGSHIEQQQNNTTVTERTASDITSQMLSALNNKIDDPAGDII